MYSSSVDHFVMDAKGYGWSTDEEGRDVLIRVPVEEDREATPQGA
jgi:cold shock CspA family protein